MSSRRSSPPSPAAPPMPPPSVEERAHSQFTTETLRELIAFHTQQNLDRAVILATMAARQELPEELVKHFGELGRRYAEFVTNRGKRKAPGRPALRLVSGDET